MQTVIGIDYGTQSARALLVDTETGEVLCAHSVLYPHGVMEGDLASAEDYESALLELLEHVTPLEYRHTVIGICVDATSLTLVPVAQNGKVLAQLPEFAGRHHAQIKLWKCHEAQAQANEALALAQDRQEPFLKRTGGTISSEWFLPKLLKIRDEDLEVYEQMDLAMDLGEYLTFYLTGTLTRSAGSMCYKGLWSQDLGFPSSAYLNGLRNGFAMEYAYKMRGPVKAPGEKAGFLKEELCERFGLSQKVTVAVGVLDGHTSLVALGALDEGDAALVIGTSNVLTIQTSQMIEIQGICGIAKDGLTAGLYGIDSGQNCTGDMLEWFLKHALPEKEYQSAVQQGISPHESLMKQITCPWDNTLVAADWWNGSRNAPCDLELRGTILGLSLETKSTHVYLALLQAIACGTREVLEICGAQGVCVKRLLAAGGIANKNPLLMQQYADLLNRKIYVGQMTEGPALGAAIFAAAAAGVYKTLEEAYEHMGIRDFVVYEPDIIHRDAYEKLYQRNHQLRQMIASMDIC